jgi:hypothetical protein
MTTSKYIRSNGYSGPCLIYVAWKENVVHTKHIYN